MSIKLPSLPKVNVPSPSNIIKPISQPVQNIVPKTQTTLTNVVKPAVVAPVVNNVVKPVDTKMTIQPVVNVSKPVVAPTNTVINVNGNTLSNAIKPVVPAVVSAVKPVVAPVVNNAVNNVVNNIVNNVVKPAVVAPVQNIVPKAQTTLTNVIAPAVAAPVVSAVKPVVAPVVNNVVKPVVAAPAAVKPAVSNIVAKAETTLKNVVAPAVAAPVKPVVAPVVNTVKPVVIGPGFTDMLNKAQTQIKPVENTINKIVDTSKNVANQVEKAIVNDTPNVFNQLFSSAKSWGDLIRDNPVVSMSAVGLLLMLV
jgi:hypothetical protein